MPHGATLALSVMTEMSIVGVETVMVNSVSVQWVTTTGRTGQLKPTISVPMPYLFQWVNNTPVQCLIPVF